MGSPAVAMKHVKDMTITELTANMLPEIRNRFTKMTTSEQTAFIARIAEAQDRLHDRAVLDSWFEQGHFYE